MNRFTHPALFLLTFGLIASCAAPQRRLIWRPDGTAVEIYKKDPDLRILAYPFRGERPIGSVIFIHGGNWSFPGADLPFFEDWYPLLAKANLRIFSIEHRVAPAHRGMEPVEDCIAAIDYVRINAGRFGVLDDKIALVGFSSGGHLAMMAAGLLSGRKMRNPIRSVVSFYAPTDLKRLYESGDERIRKIVSDYLPLLESCAKGHTAECDTQRDRLLEILSPLYRLKETTPKALLIHGTADSLVPIEQSELLFRKSESGFGNVILHPVQNADHHFDALDTKTARDAREFAIRFILGSLR